MKIIKKNLISRNKATISQDETGSYGRIKLTEELSELFKILKRLCTKLKCCLYFNARGAAHNKL
jgi:hypothetical protein